jgi:Phosphoribosyl transferase (PRTase)
MISLPDLGRANLWHQPVYAHFLTEIDPFQNSDCFRSLDSAYDGNSTFWQRPSPEPNLPDAFWQQVQSQLVSPDIQAAASRLASAILAWEPDPDQLLFVAILRAGVPIADWLCRLLPGSIAASISLFSGLGIDRVALAALKSAHPNRKLVFVDGWTGRGGVAREISQLGDGPLAVLIDPWGVAALAGSHEDLLCPSACFTGVATLGFSRTFYTNDQNCFSAYLFPAQHTRPELVAAWQASCPTALLPPLPPRSPIAIATALRVHSNEVCRALINAAPEKIYFADSINHAQENYGLILELAELRQVKVVYNCDDLQNYHTRVACSFLST